MGDACLQKNAAQSTTRIIGSFSMDKEKSSISVKYITCAL
jgi:hypothetical protein